MPNAPANLANKPKTYGISRLENIGDSYSFRYASQASAVPQNKPMNRTLQLALFALIASAFALLPGCAFNAKDQVPGVSWKRAVIDADTNGVTHCEIDNYNSKKDVALTVNPQTHAVTLGSVMNPANTTAAGIANQITITANGDAATKVSGAVSAGLGSLAGSAAGAAIKP